MEQCINEQGPTRHGILEIDTVILEMEDGHSADKSRGQMDEMYGEFYEGMDGGEYAAGRMLCGRLSAISKLRFNSLCLVDTGRHLADLVTHLYLGMGFRFTRATLAFVASGARSSRLALS